MAEKDIAECSPLHDANKELKASMEAVIRRLLLPIQQQIDDVVQRLERLEAGGGGPASSPSSSALSSNRSNFKRSSNGQGAQSRVNSPAVKISDKHFEQTKSMGTAANVKKKKKETLRKLAAAGTTSDLYMAYKGPEEKKENTISSEVADSISTDPVPANSLQGESAVNVKDSQNKVAPDDWKDVIDISTPKLETTDVPDSADRRLMQYEQNDNTNTAKNYSRDFRLKYAEQYVDLPEGFEITSDMAEVLISGNVSHHVVRDSRPIPGRAIDRSSSGARMC